MFYFIFIRMIRWSTGLFLVLFVSYSMMFYGGGDPIKQMFLEKGFKIIKDNIGSFTKTQKSD